MKSDLRLLRKYTITLQQVTTLAILYAITIIFRYFIAGRKRTIKLYGLIHHIDLHDPK